MQGGGIHAGLDGDHIARLKAMIGARDNSRRFVSTKSNAVAQVVPEALVQVLLDGVNIAREYSGPDQGFSEMQRATDTIPGALLQVRRVSGRKCAAGVARIERG